MISARMNSGYSPHRTLSGELAMQLPTTKGEDVFVRLDADENPVPVKIKSQKWTVPQVKSLFGEHATVYLCNKNLQTFPKKLRGSIMWLPSMKIVAAVIESSGRSAYVSTLHPTARAGEEHFLDDMTTLDGHWLQLAIGPDTLPIHYEYRGREAGVTLVDRNGCIKMNIAGPDVLVMGSKSVPAAVKRKMKKLKQDNPDTVLNMEPLPKRPKLNKVGVVYVYRPGGDVSKYRFVESHFDQRRKKMMPVFSIPIGALKPKSNRYAWCYGLC
jgi:hypothetical protein